MPLIPPGKRRGNRFYVFRARINGKEYEISTNTTDKEAARQSALRIEREIREAGPDLSRPLTFLDASKRYRLSRNVSKANAGFLGSLEKEIGGLLLEGIVPADVIEAGRRLYPGRTAATINRQAIGPASWVLHYAADQGWCRYWRIKKLDEPEPATRSVSPDQAMTLLAAIEDPVKKALLLCLFIQGWRITEALTMEWSHVDLPNARVQRWIAKTRKWRWQALAPEIVVALESLPRGRRVFPWGHRANVYRWLRPLCRGLGIRFTPHVARHSAATWARRNGATLNEIMKAYGWSSVKSVIRYDEVDVADQARVLSGPAKALRTK